MSAPIFTSDSKNRPYLKVRFRGGGSRWAVLAGEREAHWAGGKKVRIYKVIAETGEATNEIVLATAEDILWEKPARLNCHYGEMETL